MTKEAYEGEIAYLRNRIVQLKRSITKLKNDKAPLINALKRLYNEAVDREATP